MYMFAGIIPFIFICLTFCGVIFFNKKLQYVLLITTIIIYLIWIIFYLHYHLTDLKAYSW